MSTGMSNKKKFPVTISYVTAPSDVQLTKIKDYIFRILCKEGRSREDIEISLIKDESLKGGFVIRAGNEVIDWSLEGRIRQFKGKVEQAGLSAAALGESIVPILRSAVSEFELEAKSQEVGRVLTVGDGIATVSGLDHAQYGEIVIFECGIKGMVLDIRRDEIACILFGKDREIRENSRVVRTKKSAGIPVGENFKGRVVNALGEPIDGAGSIREDGYRPVEYPAPSIVDRKSVSVPLETGILAIDSMFPIGRGQRELIIGDRQTGKTSLALDTIINQKGKDVVCIYAAIGQKASTVARLVDMLKKNDAMGHTIIVSAFASDPAPLQYVAPYAAAAMAEYFMYKGRDVLVVYDDLSKHAVAYRAMSLLLERSPGREAYPGDVFYLHSRLLERSARLCDEKGGGSITALPIIETQAGDVSAYIPTNVISITDGQIYLESSLFFAGQRPAVNVGLSVSRVGGAAQTKAMKKAAGSIRLDLAQFREMEIFTQFASELDEMTKAQLHHGNELMQLLRQPLGRPLSMAEQVITLIAADSRAMQDLPVPKVKEFQMKLLEAVQEKEPEMIKELEATGTLTEQQMDRIASFAKEFAIQYGERLKNRKEGEYNGQYS